MAETDKACPPLRDEEDYPLPDGYHDSCLIQVRVGAKEKTFYIHELILVSKSEFFAACLRSKSTIEARTGVIKLPKDDPVAFSIILDWFYTSQIRDLYPCSQQIDYVNAYILADKFMMNRCKNAIMDALRQYFKDRPLYPSKALSRVCEPLSDSSHLIRTFFIARYAFDLYHNSVDPEEILTDQSVIKTPPPQLESMVHYNVTRYLLWFLKLAVDRKMIPDPATEKGCVYHDHTGDAA